MAYPQQRRLTAEAMVRLYKDGASLRQIAGLAGVSNVAVRATLRPLVAMRPNTAKPHWSIMRVDTLLDAESWCDGPPAPAPRLYRASTRVPYHRTDTAEEHGVQADDDFPSAAEALTWKALRRCDCQQCREGREKSPRRTAGEKLEHVRRNVKARAKARKAEARWE